MSPDSHYMCSREGYCESVSSIKCILVYLAALFNRQSVELLQKLTGSCEPTTDRSCLRVTYPVHLTTISSVSVNAKHAVENIEEAIGPRGGQLLEHET